LLLMNVKLRTSWSRGNIVDFITEVLGSVLDSDTIYPECDSSLFSPVPAGKCRDSTSIMPRTHPSLSFPIHLHLSIIQPSDTIGP
jgi:hypothetical protein